MEMRETRQKKPRSLSPFISPSITVFRRSFPFCTVSKLAIRADSRTRAFTLAVGRVFKRKFGTEVQFRWNSAERQGRIRERIPFPRGCARASNREPIYAEYGEKSATFLPGAFTRADSREPIFGLCCITDRPVRNLARDPPRREK